MYTVGSSASLGFVRAGFIFVKSPCRRGFSTKRWKGLATELPYDEQVQTNAVDERFEESCRYIDEMSYSQQASEIGVRLDGHALLLQVGHRAPSVPGAATLRKKSHRGNNRTQLTSQGLSYFDTTMNLLFYLHDSVLLFVCDNFCCWHWFRHAVENQNNKVRRVSLCGETLRSACRSRVRVRVSLCAQYMHIQCAVGL